MGDLTTLAKARIELEDLYLGVPDDSVNLTFQDLAEVTKNVAHPPPPEERKAISILEPVRESNSKRGGSSPLKKHPSLDFNRGLQASKSSPPNSHHVNKDRIDSRSMQLQVTHAHNYAAHSKNFSNHATPIGSGRHSEYRHEVLESSLAYDDRSHASMASTMNPFSQRGKHRRPGISHSNICAICNTYIYIFRHRCLVWMFYASVSIIKLYIDD